MRKVQIVYKSGVTLHLKVNHFTVSKNANGDIRELKWVSVKDRIAFLETDGIVAVIYK